MSRIAIFILFAAICPEFSLPFWFPKTSYTYSLSFFPCYLPYRVHVFWFRLLFRRAQIMKLHLPFNLLLIRGVNTFSTHCMELVTWICVNAALNKMFDVAFLETLINILILYTLGGRDSAVGIATRYGLDGPGIESRWGGEISPPVQTAPGAHQASCTMGTGSFPGVKRLGRGAGPPTSSSVPRS